MKGWIAAAALAMAGVAATSPAAPPAVELVLADTPVQGGALLGTAPKGTVELRFNGQLVPVDADGRFLIAFDRDAASQARLTGRLADGTLLDRALTVAPRDWRIERVDAPLRPTKSTEAFLALRKPELERIAAARETVTDAQGWRQRFIWPRIGRVSGLFGAQRIYQGQPGAYHGGVDIAGATGEPVVAPADGVVILAADRPFTLEGNLLMIDHGHGLNSAFLHLSRIDVIPGQHVIQGQRIGAIGATGRATGPHLHWGMKWNEARIDPILLTGPMPQN
ncbi:MULTISPECIES: M23 family metallopeptidase [Sphingobium]|uniref:Peptidase n=1 Tax=Sphingobium fuliginis (strain ATCC 27551) TaxID=336203 RepID=A0ABQ1EL35_SPHSA|nr:MULTISPECIES: M23 family metallopeptidase [Sphingobium]AJR22975.1 peptidase [Sphingobium sp. YBL2]RYM01350.1 M23 family metallopeptidase [Sphingobium fuliginis]WDA34406.1 M23 family metallopeptidase [Sphingobium sp. YC-XJ3]GFZ76202.1 peptidase [Sphingobium fuliginis]